MDHQELVVLQDLVDHQDQVVHLVVQEVVDHQELVVLQDLVDHPVVLDQVVHPDHPEVQDRVDHLDHLVHQVKPLLII